MKRFAIVACACVAAFALALAGCGASGQSQSSSGAASGADQQQAAAAQREIAPSWVSRLSEGQQTSQMFVVAGVGKTTATCGLYQKDEEGTWRTVVSTPGYIGKEGLGKTKEGDGKTPIGDFTFNKAFGIAADPGCAIEYTQVDDNTYWSGDDRDGMHYNELVSIKDLPDLNTEASEHIVDYQYHYQYCMNISYNDKGTPGKGSAIFLHCLGPNKPFTGGCVAIPQDKMVEVMKNVEPTCAVVINSLEALNGDLDLPTDDDFAIVGSANAAAQRAGIDSFEAAEKPAPNFGEVIDTTFEARTNAAKVAYGIGASTISVYKGIAGGNGDITTGEATDEVKYKESWTLEINGMNVECYGAKKGAAQKAIYQVGEYDCAVTAVPEGGDDEFGIDKDTLEAFITAVK